MHPVKTLNNCPSEKWWVRLYERAYFMRILRDPEVLNGAPLCPYTEYARRWIHGQGYE